MIGKGQHMEDGGEGMLVAGGSWREAQRPFVSVNELGGADLE